MKTKIELCFDTIGALRLFDEEVYIKGNYCKKQHFVPTIMKLRDGYAIEYGVSGRTARRLVKERENFRHKKELMFKSIELESLV